MIVSHCVAPPAGTEPCSGPTWRMNASSTITQVARHLQLVAAADADAVDARQRRLADLAQPVVRLLERAEPLPVLGRVADEALAPSLRSAPTQNARPVPVRTTTRIASSHEASSHARASSRSVRKSNAFSTSGRLKRIVARGGAFS